MGFFIEEGLANKSNVKANQTNLYRAYPMFRITLKIKLSLVYFKEHS